LLTGIIGSLDLMQKRIAQGRYGDDRALQRPWRRPRRTAPRR
jgi:hypothetical protein